MTETDQPNLYRARDRITREMVKDLARDGETEVIKHALYSYGMWLESQGEDVWEQLPPVQPTNRTFGPLKG